jgi:hypothetical protein
MSLYEIFRRFSLLLVLYVLYVHCGRHDSDFGANNSCLSSLPMYIHSAVLRQSVQHGAPIVFALEGHRDFLEEENGDRHFLFRCGAYDLSSTARVEPTKMSIWTRKMNPIGVSIDFYLHCNLNGLLKHATTDTDKSGPHGKFYGIAPNAKPWISIFRMQNNSVHEICKVHHSEDLVIPTKQPQPVAELCTFSHPQYGLREHNLYFPVWLHYQLEVLNIPFVVVYYTEDWGWKDLPALHQDDRVISIRFPERKMKDNAHNSLEAASFIDFANRFRYAFKFAFIHDSDEYLVSIDHGGNSQPEKSSSFRVSANRLFKEDDKDRSFLVDKIHQYDRTFPSTTSYLFNTFIACWNNSQTFDSVFTLPVKTRATPKSLHKMDSLGDGTQLTPHFAENRAESNHVYEMVGRTIALGGLCIAGFYLFCYWQDHDGKGGLPHWAYPTLFVLIFYFFFHLFFFSVKERVLVELSKGCPFLVVELLHNSWFVLPATALGAYCLLLRQLTAEKLPFQQYLSICLLLAFYAFWLWAFLALPKRRTVMHIDQDYVGFLAHVRNSACHSLSQDPNPKRHHSLPSEGRKSAPDLSGVSRLGRNVKVFIPLGTLAAVKQLNLGKRIGPAITVNESQPLHSVSDWLFLHSEYSSSLYLHSRITHDINNRFITQNLSEAQLCYPHCSDSHGLPATESQTLNFEVPTKQQKHFSHCKSITLDFEHRKQQNGDHCRVIVPYFHSIYAPSPHPQNKPWQLQNIIPKDILLCFIGSSWRGNRCDRTIDQLKEFSNDFSPGKNNKNHIKHLQEQTPRNFTSLFSTGTIFTRDASEAGVWETERLLIESWELYSRSYFSWQPGGDSPTRRAFYDSWMFGCIPVISSTSVNEYRSLFNHKLFSGTKSLAAIHSNTSSVSGFRIEEVVVVMSDQEMTDGETILSRLLAMGSEEISQRLERMASLAMYLQWSDSGESDALTTALGSVYNP